MPIKIKLCNSQKSSLIVASKMFLFHNQNRYVPFLSQKYFQIYRACQFASQNSGFIKTNIVRIFFCIFLQSTHQIYMKKVVECWKEFSIDLYPDKTSQARNKSNAPKLVPQLKFLWFYTPARTLFISGLKSRVLKLLFLNLK